MGVQIDEQAAAREPAGQPTGGMHSEGGLTYPGRPAYGVNRHGLVAAGICWHRGGDAGKFVIPPGERDGARRERVPHRYTRCRIRRRTEYLRQSVKYLQFETGIGGELTDDQPGIEQPLPESLHRGSVRIGQGRGDTGAVGQQEHQPRYPRGGGLIELQLGVGHRRAWHRVPRSRLLPSQPAGGSAEPTNSGNWADASDCLLGYTEEGVQRVGYQKSAGTNLTSPDEGVP